MTTRRIEINGKAYDITRVTESDSLVDRSYITGTGDLAGKWFIVRSPTTVCTIKANLKPERKPAFSGKHPYLKRKKGRA